MNVASELGASAYLSPGDVITTREAMIDPVIVLFSSLADRDKVNFPTPFKSSDLKSLSMKLPLNLSFSSTASPATAQAPTDSEHTATTHHCRKPARCSLHPQSPKSKYIIRRTTSLLHVLKKPLPLRTAPCLQAHSVGRRAHGPSALSTMCASLVHQHTSTAGGCQKRR